MNPLSTDNGVLRGLVTLLNQVREKPAILRAASKTRILSARCKSTFSSAGWRPRRGGGLETQLLWSSDSTGVNRRNHQRLAGFAIEAL
jgi:hypothetical protein